MFDADSQPVAVQLLTGTTGSAPERGREGGKEGEIKIVNAPLFSLPFLL